MKKIFSLVALVGMFALMSFDGFSANHIENNRLIYSNSIKDINASNQSDIKINKLVEIINIQQIRSTHTTSEGESIKCWLMIKWLRHKLEGVSNNTALIDQIIDAVDFLCDLADQLDVL